MPDWDAFKKDYEKQIRAAYDKASAEGLPVVVAVRPNGPLAEEVGRRVFEKTRGEEADWDAFLRSESPVLIEGFASAVFLNLMPEQQRTHMQPVLMSPLQRDCWLLIFDADEVMLEPIVWPKEEEEGEE